MKFMSFFNILNINFKEVIFFITFFIIVFYEIFIKLNYLLSTQNYLLEAFATLPNHINYLHTNIKYVTILYFYDNLSCICISFCILINRVTYSSTYIPFSTVNNMSISVKRSSFTLVFLKLLVMLIQELKEILQDQIGIF